MLTVAQATTRLVPAVDRAARVLAFLETQERPLGISEIARHLGASKGAVRDVLETLRSHGLLDRDEASKQYRLGARLVRLGNAAMGRVDLGSAARPVMGRLAQETGETVLLVVRQGERAQIVEKAESDLPTMRISEQVGRRIPLMAGASGKIWMAFATDADRDRHLKRLPLYTERGAATEREYREMLESARRYRFALDEQEYLEGVNAVGAPVFDARGELAAVLLVVGLAGSLTDERLPETARAARGAAAAISAALGARTGEGLRTED